MILKGARVICKREPTPERLGLIWIPERAQRKTLEGIIVQVGDTVRTVEVGQRVLFPARSWSPFPLLGDDHVLCWERDLLGVLEPDDILGVLT